MRQAPSDDDLVKHWAYNIAKWEIEEALQEIQLSNYDKEVTTTAYHRVIKYAMMLKDILVEEDPTLYNKASKEYLDTDNKDE